MFMKSEFEREKGETKEIGDESANERERESACARYYDCIIRGL